MFNQETWRACLDRSCIHFPPCNVPYSAIAVMFGQFLSRTLKCTGMPSTLVSFREPPVR